MDISLLLYAHRSKPLAFSRNYFRFLGKSMKKYVSKRQKFTNTGIYLSKNIFSFYKSSVILISDEIRMKVQPASG